MVFWNMHLFGKLRSAGDAATDLEKRYFSFPVMRTKVSGPLYIRKRNQPIHPQGRAKGVATSFVVK